MSGDCKTRMHKVRLACKGDDDACYGGLGVRSVRPASPCDGDETRCTIAGYSAGYCARDLADTSEHQVVYGWRLNGGANLRTADAAYGTSEKSHT